MTSHSLSRLLTTLDSQHTYTDTPTVTSLLQNGISTTVFHVDTSDREQERQATAAGQLELVTSQLERTSVELEEEYGETDDELWEKQHEVNNDTLTELYYCTNVRVLTSN